MDLSVRAIIINAQDEILLVKHANSAPWTLPGGHGEEEEHIYDTLTRELHEELGLKVTVIGSDTVFSDHHIVSYPLPISIHHIQYEHRTKGPVEKIEYIFFARTQDEIDDTVVDTEEIVSYAWMSQEDIFAMDPNIDIFLMIQELLEQHGDLLEIL